MQLRVRADHLDAWVVLSVSGDLDLATGPTLLSRAHAEIAAGNHDLMLDLSGCDFLDSMGLGIIVALLKRVKSHDGRLELVCPTRRVRRLFDLTGLATVLTIHDELPVEVGNE